MENKLREGQHGFRANTFRSTFDLIFEVRHIRKENENLTKTHVLLSDTEAFMKRENSVVTDGGKFTHV